MLILKPIPTFCNIADEEADEYEQVMTYHACPCRDKPHTQRISLGLVYVMPVL